MESMFFEFIFLIPIKVSAFGNQQFAQQLLDKGDCRVVARSEIVTRCDVGIIHLVKQFE